MIVVAHRVNTREELSRVDPSHGIEFDLRSNRGKLILAHNALAEGENAEATLRQVRTSLAIVNVKEDGLEERFDKWAKDNFTNDYFFLDQTPPAVLLRGSKGLRNNALRVTEFDSLGYIAKMANFCEWAWIDPMFSSPDMASSVLKAKDCGLKVCLASPELYSADRLPEIARIHDEIDPNHVNAVCTKLPSIWDGWS